MSLSSRAEASFWLGFITIFCVAWPWKSPLVVNAIILALVPAGTIITLRTYGHRIACIYAIASCSLILLLYSFAIRTHRQSIGDYIWIALDAIWAAFIIGVVTWLFVVAARRLQQFIANLCHYNSTVDRSK